MLRLTKVMYMISLYSKHKCTLFPKERRLNSTHKAQLKMLDEVLAVAHFS